MKKIKKRLEEEERREDRDCRGLEREKERKRDMGNRGVGKEVV